MTEIKIKNPSSLVQAVVALDNHFSELNRLSERIESMDMKSDFDLEQIQRLITHFSETGEGVSKEVVSMSNALNEARAQAEAAAQIVSAKAEILASRRTEQNKKMEEFRQLGEKVRTLTMSLNEFKRPEGEVITPEDRLRLSKRLLEFDSQLKPLIEEAEHLKKEGHSAKIKILEQGAQSLGQSLIAISKKLTAFQQENQLS